MLCRVAHLAEFRPLRVSWKSLIRATGGLDFVERLIDVRAGLDLHSDRCDPWSRYGPDRVDVVESAYLLFHFHYDRVLDLIGGRTGIRHGDLDRVEGKVGQASRSRRLIDAKPTARIAR